MDQPTPRFTNPAEGESPETRHVDIGEADYEIPDPDGHDTTDGIERFEEHYTVGEIVEQGGQS